MKRAISKDDERRLRELASVALQRRREWYAAPFGDHRIPYERFMDAAADVSNFAELCFFPSESKALSEEVLGSREAPDASR